LALRLLRQGWAIGDALRDDHELDEIPSDTGRLFVGQAPATPPTWSSFIGQFSKSPKLKLWNQSCGAILFLNIATEQKPPIKRVVALTFGTGHHALDPDAFERGFGLRVTLNSVARSDLRTVDFATLDATTFLRRIQASRNADLQGFGIDTERDLLTLAAGSPKDATFARSLAGRDSLNLNTRTSPIDVLEKCKKAVALYEATDYRKDFGFIDYVSPVRQRDLFDELDALAFAELLRMVKGDASDLHIALPDILDPQESVEIGYYGLGLKSGSKPPHLQLAIEDYVAELVAGDFSQVKDMAELRGSHEVRVIADGEGDKKRKRKLYDCFVFEVEHGGTVYVLFAGEWFAVDQAFYKEVEDDFAKLIAKPFVAYTMAANEREFIAELAVNKNLLNLDQVKLNPTAMGGAALEPCDFLSMERQFIHLKDGNDSAPISHLWNQGAVSAEAFVRDEKFRRDFRAETVDRQRKSRKNGFEKLLPDGRSKPTPSEYTVVYGIMRSPYKRSGKLGLPFFSKISLRAIADRIALMGFTVEVHLIEKRRAATKPKAAKSQKVV
ncbi:MAG: DUF6119 family protein, partial [Pseudorhodoplanes sp.]